MNFIRGKFEEVKEYIFNIEGHNTEVKYYDVDSRGVLKNEKKYLVDNEEIDDLPFDRIEPVNIEEEVVVKGLILQATCGGSKIYYHYNKKDQLIREDMIIENPNDFQDEWTKTFYKYDDEGLLIEEVLVGDYVPYNKVAYEYAKIFIEDLNTIKFLKKEVLYDKYERIKYSYNKYGDIVQEIHGRDNSGKYTTVYDYEYKYNELFNWVEKRKISNGKVVKSYKRDYIEEKSFEVDF